jgi:DNA-binding response OmpR family regulator
MREINMTMVSQERLLYIEFASDLAEAFKHKMNEAGCDVDIASDGSEGLQLCNINTYDIVIAEYKIPGIDGLWR